MLSAQIPCEKPSAKLTKKDWLKMIEEIKDPFYCEALIAALEARRRKLNANFKGETPKG